VSGTLKDLQALEAAGFRVVLLAGLNEIRIGKHRIHILKRKGASTQLAIPSKQQSTWTHHLIQLVAPANPEWIAALQNLGIAVIERVSRYAYFVACKPEVLDKARSLDFVSWVGPFLPVYRMAPGFEKTKGIVKYLSVGILGEEAVDEIRAILKKMGGTIVLEEPPDMFSNPHYHTIMAEVDARAIKVLALNPDVRWLSTDGEAKASDERSVQIVSGDLDGAAPPNTAPMTGYAGRLAELGLTGGAGITIAICDTGIDTNDDATLHPDLSGRMSFFVDKTSAAVTSDTDGHGTHVAGIAVGAPGAPGEIDPQNFLLGQGMAPAASFGSINPVGNVGFNISAVSKDAVTNGATLQNNSWEFTTNGQPAPDAGYDATCRFTDIRVRNANDDTQALEQLVHVFAAGNEGPLPHTIVRPHEAKNIIVVGASLNHRPGEPPANDDIRGIDTGSSRGPCLDGRLAPNVVAPGIAIVSARSFSSTDSTYTDTGSALHASHTVKHGTSMAAPHVTGLCALLVEWWQARTGGLHPSAALLKAMLVNGAVDLAGGSDGNGGTLANIPNNNQGWGRVDLGNMLLQTADRGPKILFDRDLEAFTDSGQSLELQVGVVDTSKPLRVTLAWTDANGGIDQNPALVNNLNLEVQEILTGDQLGQLFKGNVFPDGNGFSAPGGDANTFDNLECVYIQNPIARYVVRIVADSVTADARQPSSLVSPWQDFAFVIDNAIRANIDNPVSVVPVIDRSSSMVSSGYVDITRTASKNFIDLLQVNDATGVVSFGTTGNMEFSNGSGGLVSITGDTERADAKNAVDAIAFSGCTFMGDGINKARDLLTGATTERAIVLLSDGFDNKGCEPNNAAKPSAIEAAATLPAGLPIYACAMGPESDQVLLEQLATMTGGRYYFMPAIEELGEIYNYIHAQIAGEDESIITNASMFASKSRMSSLVDATADRVTFSVMWYDKTLKYHAQDIRKEAIQVKLYDPRGKLVHPRSTLVHTIVGEGYVIFRIDEPAAGKWTIEVETSRKEHTLCTVGGFVHSRLRLRVPRGPQVIKAGGLFHQPLQVHDNNFIVRQTRAHTRVNAPAVALDDLLRKHKTKWMKERLVGARRDAVPSNLAKFMAYRARILKQSGKDLIQRVERTVPTQQVADGAALSLRGLSGAAHLARIDTTTPGSHNLRLTVAGFSREHNTKFVRHDLVSVVVV